MDTIDAKALRYFLAVIRFGSIRGAAEHFDVAPSVVSRQVMDLEQRLGLSLFDRSVRGVTMTQAGELVLEHGNRVVQDHAVLIEQLDRLRGVQQSRVRILCGEGFIGDLFENGLHKFGAICPGIQFTVQPANTDTIVMGVSGGDADIGIVYNLPSDTRTRSLVITRQPLCAIMPLGHPLRTREAVSLAECLESPCGILTKGHGVRHLVGRAAADAGLALTPLVETASQDALRRFVTAGLGITFLPRFAVASEEERGVLGVVPLTDTLLNEASAHLIVRAYRRLPPSVEALAGFLAREMAAFAPG